MDGLSSASAIIAVAGLLAKVVKKLIHNVKSIRHAKEEVMSIVSNVGSFSKLLHLLADMIRQFPPEILLPIREKKVDVAIVNQANSIVIDIKNYLIELEPLRVSDRTNTLSRWILRLLWPFKKNRVLILIKSLESAQMSLSLLMDAIQLSALLRQLTPSSVTASALRAEIKLLKTHLKSNKTIIKSMMEDYRALLTHVNDFEVLNGAEIAGQIVEATLQIADQQLREYREAQGEDQLNRNFSTNSSHNSGPGSSDHRFNCHESKPDSRTTVKVGDRSRGKGIASNISPEGKWEFSEIDASEVDSLSYSSWYSTYSSSSSMPERRSTVPERRSTVPERRSTVPERRSTVPESRLIVAEPRLPKSRPTGRRPRTRVGEYEWSDSESNAS